ncbi:putrescine carbamoyltransferase [Photobacterium carnosum]|uniref:putrescine carbamoyltransferase n=1 Tax=Photobacterium carnosum TaxID=2023717 RepID=UPI001C928543|nr:putrescine carbamoyltransferase [Photobacterium carnosum]MBY3788508.1 putrescine carbamoyltransferase [Photobacterium carnosum]MCD9494872.1 putrescine carbamoyltransferase [Photobacterium carnosum]MCD9533674.1 putrescine carbamoyltransferase [Photobacterium carnosum]MCD9552867.1 putrescine carbamoyltransferase [Photobacterium carnosum]
MKLPSSSATNLNKEGLRHFLKTQDYTKKELEDILHLMKLLKDARHDNAIPQLFKGKSVAMIFEQPSTRTRVSFETAATLLGGHGLFLSPKDIHLGAKESLEDTGRVLSRMVDVIMARVDKHETVAGLAANASVPVINGLCDWLHPTQIMADLFTMVEHLPEGKKLEDLTVAFVGDATNVCSSLMFACTKFGMTFKHICPDQFKAPQEWVDIALNNCETYGGKLVITNNTDEVAGCDIIVADSFYWFGQEDEKEIRLSTFIPEFVVTEELMAKAGKDAMFMHCLPANDQRECTREVMESNNSIIFDEAENRLSAQMALLVYLTHKFIEEPTEAVRKEHEDKINGFLKTL